MKVEFLVSCSVEWIGPNDRTEERIIAGDQRMLNVLNEDDHYQLIDKDDRSITVDKDLVRVT